MWPFTQDNGQPEPDYGRQRASMVERQLRSRGISDAAVLAVMLELPRHEFIDPEFRQYAYEDRPVPIAAGQTISQPYMVAIMTEALNLRGGEKLLEIGTGSGYQTALLAKLAARIYTIEREHELVEAARSTLERLSRAGLLDAGRIEFVEADGTEGYAAAAPYDGILVAAAAPSVPPSLEEQLGEGGRLVIPVGELNNQELRLVRKIAGRLVTTVINECRFVPLLGKQGWAV